MDINDIETRELYQSLSIPSIINSHSLAVDYMQKWFLSKFKSNYFKKIHIDKRHILHEFKQEDYNNIRALKAAKPSLAIIPNPQFDFNRDMVDLNQQGLGIYHRRSKLDRHFFKDLYRNMYLGVSLDQLLINFTFRIRVSTRAQQVDLASYMNMAFRIGSTQGEDIDMDIHIPYSLMMQVAKDAEFEVIDDKVVNVVEFVAYLNKHSLYPILYKFRAINGKSEFFMRLSGLYTHISCLESLSLDDGERQGHLNNDFVIEMGAQLKIASPKLYSYYSLEKHDIIDSIESDEDSLGIGVYNVKLADIPEVNQKGWTQYLTTEYQDKDLSNNLVIEFRELFSGGELNDFITRSKNMYISPSLYIDFKLFNNGDEIEYEIDWDKFTITTKKPIQSEITNISIYIDNEYLNTELINIKNLSEDRIRQQNG